MLPAGERPLVRDSAACPALHARMIAAPSATGPAAPDIILCASVNAREVRFASQPRLSVRLTGQIGDTVHVLERKNLPDPVVPGTTYRDVYVAVEILGHLAGSCSSDSTGAGGAAPDSTRSSLSPSLCATILAGDSASRRRQ